MDSLQRFVTSKWFTRLWAGVTIAYVAALVAIDANRQAMTALQGLVWVVLWVSPVAAIFFFFWGLRAYVSEGRRDLTLFAPVLLSLIPWIFFLAVAWQEL